MGFVISQQLCMHLRKKENLLSERLLIMPQFSETLQSSACHSSDDGDMGRPFYDHCVHQELWRVTWGPHHHRDCGSKLYALRVPLLLLILHTKGTCIEDSSVGVYWFHCCMAQRLLNMNVQQC
jgi:hypothetical protein